MKDSAQKQINDWKSQYGEVYSAKYGDKICYLRKPTRKELSFASSIKDPIRFNESILNAIFLGGDEEFKTDDALFMGISATLATLIEAKEVELGKL